MNEHVTLVHPDPRGPTARGISSGFPADLLSQSAGRLRVLALLYAFVFFMAGIFPALLFPSDRARFLGSFLQWGPSVIGIVAALLVAAVIRSARLPLPAAMNIGLAFEIASSYAIAAAEFADPMGLEMHRGMLGLSWVAVWIVLFTVVVPTSPRRAVLAALAIGQLDPRHHRAHDRVRRQSLRLAEVEGASAWTQVRAREWWATHQLSLP